jgi:hypothetical protein
LIFESPDGGYTIYARKPGDSVRVLHHIDDLTLREERLASRWVKLKEAVFLEDPVVDDLIEKIEIIMELKKSSILV